MQLLTHPRPPADVPLERRDSDFTPVLFRQYTAQARRGAVG